MTLTRRNFFKILAASSAAIVTTSGLQGCNSDSTGEPDVRFDHGVASGDPLTDSIILWTRATPQHNQPVTLTWEVASDPAFSQLVNQDSASVDATTDYTLKVDVQGLQAGQTYYYRFKHGETLSPTGQTRTLPADPQTLSLAVFSCANFPAGFFHVYQDAANKAHEIDIALHLGDYIYEYDTQGYPDAGSGETIGRMHTPTHECVTLADYRTRYAQYRGDASLQALHRAVPFICVWDDHEIANDTYESGAENHQADEGDFNTRKLAAIQAWYEWLPVRAPQIEADRIKTWRRFDFGNLASVMMLDTRVYGRNRQLDYLDYFSAQGEFDAATFSAELTAADRTLLGNEQLNWLSAQLTDSKAQGIHWQLLGQQVLMARMQLPASIIMLDPQTGKPDPANLIRYQTVAAAYQNLASAVVTTLQADGTILTYAAQIAGFAEMSATQQAIALTETLKIANPTQYQSIFTTLSAAEQTVLLEDGMLLDPSLNPAIPYNLDAWDGYYYERELILTQAKALQSNLLVLAGDTHNAWCSSLTEQTGETVGVEFATASVSSPGMEKYLQIPPGYESNIETGIVTLVNDLHYFDSARRGYLLLTLTAETASAQWYALPRGAEQNPTFHPLSLVKTLTYSPSQATLS